MKAPPPLAATLAGNLKKFPNPTADPATAIMIPILDDHLSRLGLFKMAYSFLFKAKTSI